jgi:hypothetical protein
MIKNKKIINKVIIGGALLILLFLVASNIVTKSEEKLNPPGFCIPKEQYDCDYYNTSKKCSNAPDYLMCQWRSSNRQCVKAECYNIEDETKCNSYSKILNCAWKNNICQEATCTGFTTENDCKSNPYNLDCGWKMDNTYLKKNCAVDSYSQGCASLNYDCRETFCDDIKSKSLCNSETDNLSCGWAGNHCEQTDSDVKNELDVIINMCTSFNDKDNCISDEKCMWQPPSLCAKLGICDSW